MSNGMVPISEKAGQVLRRLSEQTGKPVPEILEQAIEDYRRKVFIEQVNAGYAALRADPEAWAEELAERKLWETTLMDGLDPQERWSAEGHCLNPEEEEELSMAYPCRGEIWPADLGVGEGHEQAGQRPVLVLSIDPFNAGPAGLVIVTPLTSKFSKSRNIATHVPVSPPEGGLTMSSVILCDQVRSISKDRLGAAAWGTISATTLADVEDAVRILMGL